MEDALLMPVISFLLAVVSGVFFELFESAQHALKHHRVRVWKDFTGGADGAKSFAGDDSAGDADHCAAGRNGFDNYRAGADEGTFADCYGAEHFGSGSYHHVFLDGRMPFAAFEGHSSETHSLIDKNAVADFCGFADDDSHAVVDDHAPAQFRAGVYFHSREKSRDVRDKTRKQRHISRMQKMRKSVRYKSVKPRIT